MARPKKQPDLPCNIFQRADGVFQAWVEVSLRDGTTERRKREGQTEDDVKRKVRELLAEVADNDGEAPAKGKQKTLEQWFSTWLTTIAPYGKKKIRQSSIDGYMSMLENWVFPRIGHLTLPRIEISDLDELYAAMYDAGKAESTVRKCHAIIRRGITVAQQRDLVKRNVAAIRDNPGSTNGVKRKPLTREQSKAFLAEVNRRHNRLRWIVGLAIGPRQGEILGLRWQFVDIHACTVLIDWQLQRQKWRHGCADAIACARKHCRTGPCPPTWEHGCEDPASCTGRGRGKVDGKAKPKYCPKAVQAERCRLHRRACPKPCKAGCKAHAAQCKMKTGGGLKFVRPKALHAADGDEVTSEPVALARSVMGELEDAKAKQAVHAAALGDRWNDFDLVFCQDNGMPIDPAADLRDLKDILKAAGLPNLGTHAAQRYTAATILRSLGIRIEDIQAVLRHKDIRTTRGYLGEDQAGTRRAARAMDAAMFSRSSDTDLDTAREDLVRRRTARRRPKR